jgi:hypothetical protein
MGEEIRAGLSVDLSAVGGQLSQVDAKVLQADQKTAGIKQAVARLQASLKIAQTQATELDRTTSRIESRLTRAGIKTGIAYGVGTIVSEFGIPEAAQPIAHIGTAAVSGAMFGGPWGAAGFATLATVRELFQAVKRLDERIEKAQAEVILNRRKVEEILARREREAQERQRRLDDRIAVARVQAEQDAMNWYHERIRSLMEPQ